MSFFAHYCRQYRPVITFVFVTCGLAGPLCGFQKNGSIYTTDGSQNDVNAAIASAVPGDTVTIPAGTFTWGAKNSGTVLSKSITLTGAGPGVTIINQSSESSGLIYVQGGPPTTNAVIKSFTVKQSMGKRVFFCGGVDGWRFTDLEVIGISGRLWDVNAAYGVIDKCDITMPQEQMFMYGKTDAWTTKSTMGTDQAWYIEDCVFRGDGYTDANADAKMVLRFNTVHGRMKFDAHGKWSNTPSRSARHVEIYNNIWDNQTYAWAALELRGGTGRIFNNVATCASTAFPWFIMQEYYVTMREKTTADYPIDGQIGVGQEPKVAASEPMYHWGNRNNAAVNPAIWKWQVYSVEMSGVIENDRDVYQEVAAFDGSSGVGIGTAAQMAGISPTRKGVAFWVTDQGEWNGKNGTAPDGQLYRWTGTQWELDYIPYQYPHPLTTGKVVTNPEPKPVSSPKAPSNLRVR